MASNLPLAETVGMALTTLKANRLRSLLTMLGIVIGNASVITLVGVGRGVVQAGAGCRRRAPLATLRGRRGEERLRC